MDITKSFILFVYQKLNNEFMIFILRFILSLLIVYCLAWGVQFLLDWVALDLNSLG